jgi:hypothetical protein
MKLYGATHGDHRTYITNQDCPHASTRKMARRRSKVKKFLHRQGRRRAAQQLREAIRDNRLDDM